MSKAPGKKCANVLTYWESVEYFTPQTLPSEDPQSDFSPVYSVTPGDLFPWEPDHPHNRKQLPHQTGWNYTVYACPMDVAFIRNELEAMIGNKESKEARDERAPAKAAMFGFGVDRFGVCDPASFLFSTCAWAFSRAIQMGAPLPNTWLDGYSTDERVIREWFSEQCGDQELDHTMLERLICEMIKVCPVPEEAITRSRLLIQARRFKLKSKDIAKRQTNKRAAPNLGKDSAPLGDRLTSGQDLKPVESADKPADLLNSMFLGDLHMIAGKVRQGVYGPALAGYLGKPPVAQHDLRQDLKIAWETLNPNRFPLGRWPGKGRHPLVFSQQAAVNIAFKDLANGGIMAVNGPPGTGKTTLLKDIVAGILVDRAKVLAQFTNPQDVFGESAVAWRGEKWTMKYSPLDRALDDFGIVVASSNNGAVENVTLEFPQEKDVDSAWGKRKTPFKEVADRLLEGSAWSLISARLGKKANRNAFLSNFWFDVKGEPPESVVLSKGADSIIKGSKLGLADWRRAVAFFLSALRDESRIREVREAIYRDVGTLDEVHQVLSRLRERIKEAEQSLQQLESNIANVKHDVYKHARAARNAGDRILKLRAMPPSVLARYLSRLFAIESVRVWKANLSKAWASRRKAVDRFNHCKATHANLCKKSNKAAGNLEILRSELETSTQMLHEMTHRIEAFEAETGMPVLRYDADNNQISWRAGPSGIEKECAASAKELSSPMGDAAWNAARVKVFLAAIDLHEVFVQVAGTPLLDNLRTAINIIKGDAPADLPPLAAKSAWNSMFLLVPLVSTTFSSFHRQFSHLGSENIGWLLVDEAGQALPQHAVGAIWRSKRSLLVGDPLQLKPIISVPFSLQDTLRVPWSVPKTFLPGKTSAQGLADAASSYGSKIGKQWVGAPLLVHRRCFEPMFSLCNTIAYDNAMVYGKGQRAPESVDRASAWIDVASTESEGNWIPEEGRAVDNLIREIVTQGQAPESIFLVSPFRAVVRELKRLIKREASFNGVQAGTIHTVQGKSASTVILVLGGHPEKHGAKQWASEEPNLLNVAASRAEDFFYIVGNKDSWRKYPFFCDAAAFLETRDETSGEAV